MAKFTAHYGVQFAEPVPVDPKDASKGERHSVWAHFEIVPGEPGVSLTGQQGGVGSRVYAFETDDEKVAERLRKIDDYGITEVK